MAQIPGLLEPGNIDLYAQPKVANPKQGGTSTVFSASFDMDGKSYLLPSVTPDGRFLSTDDEIIGEFKRTGRHLGIFRNHFDADKYGGQLHEAYAAGKYEKGPMNQGGQYECPAGFRCVQIPGDSTIHQFPEDATDAQISAALKAIPAANAKDVPKARTWTDTAVDLLPAAGATIGGAMGTELGPVGIAAGAGAGGALGKAVQQKVNVMRGVSEAPGTVGEALLPVAKEGAIDAAVGGVGAAALSGPGGKIVGMALDRLGSTLEKFGASRAASELSKGGGIVELFRGDPKGAAMVMGAPYAAGVAGRAMQAGSRLLTGMPNETGMVQMLYDAATRPQNAVKLNPFEASFLSSVGDQLMNQGRKLTVAQRDVLKRIFTAKMAGP